MRSSLAAVTRLASLALTCALAPITHAQETSEPAPVASTGEPAKPPVIEASEPGTQEAADAPLTITAPVSITGETIIPITMEDAVQLALASNLGLRIESFNRDTARESLIIADSAFEPVFAASAQTTKSETPTTVETTTTNSSTRTTGVLSASQRIDTGATVSVQSNLGRTEASGGAASTNLYYGSDLSLNVRQPLLAGAGFRVNRAARDRARIGVERSEITFRGQALDIVRDTEVAFFDLASAHYTLDVQLSGLATAQRFLDENEARRSAGIATELDVMQARVSVANRRAQIIAAEQRVRDATDRLLALFGRRDFSGMLQPTGYVFAPPSHLSVEQSYGRAADRNTEVQNATGLLRQLEIDALSARNNRLPRLDLTGGLTYSGFDRYDEDNNRNPGLGGALDDMSNRDAYNWQLGVSLNLPWGMNEARARMRIADYSVAQQKVRLEQIEQTLMINIRYAIRAVESDTETVDINALSTALTKREFELEKAKFDSGLSTSRLVVEAQQRWDEAQVRETQSRVQLRQNLARLRRLEGVSLEIYGVDALAAP